MMRIMASRMKARHIGVVRYLRTFSIQLARSGRAVSDLIYREAGHGRIELPGPTNVLATADQSTIGEVVVAIGSALDLRYDRKTYP